MNWKILQEPYPFSISLKKEVISSLFFGLFVFLFLFLFQPIGLSQYHSSTKTLELAGYGAVTTSILFLNNLIVSILFPKWFSTATWTVGKNIFYTLYIFFCIGLGNLIYSVFQGYLKLDFNGFIFYQGMTLMVGLFPVTISTFVIYSNRLKKAVDDAKGLNSALTTKEINSSGLIHIPSQNKSENLEIDINHLLAVKAIENYIEVYVLDKDGLQKSILRNTLKNLDTVFSDFKFIQKCHRSYLVNLNNVKGFSGNAQGLKLGFDDSIDLSVMVSRAYVKEIKLQLENDK